MQQQLSEAEASNDIRKRRFEYDESDVEKRKKERRYPCEDTLLTEDERRLEVAACHVLMLMLIPQGSEARAIIPLLCSSSEFWPCCCHVGFLLRLQASLPFVGCFDRHSDIIRVSKYELEQLDTAVAETTTVLPDLITHGVYVHVTHTHRQCCMGC